MLSEWLRHPLVRGAVTGLVAAAAVDYIAFRKFKTLTEFKQYDWSVAAWRWLQGTLGGLVTGAGLGVVS
jgi:hypothetical protein